MRLVAGATVVCTDVCLKKKKKVQKKRRHGRRDGLDQSGFFLSSFNIQILLNVYLSVSFII